MKKREMNGNVPSLIPSLGPTIGRRAFVRILGTGMIALSFCTHVMAGPGTHVMAGPFSQADLPRHLVPTDKKLSDAWRAALTERGQGEVFSGEQLKYIGMPVGGIGCGQLYLGGDGRLWLWDIFKCNYRREPDHGNRIAAFTLGGHYAHPVAQGETYTKWNGADVQQGFLVRTKAGTKTLDREGFPGVTFRGEYPVGKVTYAEKGFPLTVELEAFSPFIPLNAKDSALPATVMSFTVTNTSEETHDVDLCGWMQNATCPYEQDASLGQRRNRVVQADGRISLLHTVEASAASGEMQGDLESKHGFGSTALTLMHEDDEVSTTAATSLSDPASPEKLFDQLGPVDKEAQAVEPLNELLVGGLSAGVTLAPGESKTIDFAITWYFPDYNEIDAAPGLMLRIKEFRTLRRHYAPWFNSAGEVAGYLAGHKDRLLGGTRAWNRTWYDSTLPHWLLDRSFIGLDCIATQTFHWFDNGRPYAWEGVDCCPGTCTHVWHYAQALGRIFPELERAFREKVDFKAGVGFHPKNGMISDRGDFHAREATDGQAGTILRAYREHLMSKDDAFLRRLWPRVKQSIEFLIAKDPEKDGLLDGRQPHTLDAAWYGPMGWISGLYLAALQAGEAMATEMDDDAFAATCRELVAEGRKQIVNVLFDGEYFIHKPDPRYRRRALQTGEGCHIDQVLGQAWICQVGLERVIPKAETVSALNSLWKYNFAPDAGRYALEHIQIEKAFRWYAMPGEAGLLMTTWPKGGAMEAVPGNRLRTAKNPAKFTGAGGYFNECMNGFEYQVAAHMIYEGEPGDALVEKGLAVARAVHDRYGAEKRNPYNEIECGDHYARSMASYGIFLAACGYHYNGPQGRIAFAPRLTPEDFRAPFTAAEGWGTFAQNVVNGRQSASIELRYGELALNEFAVDQVKGTSASRAVVSMDGKEIPAEFLKRENQYVVRFPKGLSISAEQKIDIRFVS